MDRQRAQGEAHVGENAAGCGYGGRPECTPGRHRGPSNAWQRPTRAHDACSADTGNSLCNTVRAEWFSSTACSLPPGRLERRTSSQTYSIARLRRLVKSLMTSKPTCGQHWIDGVWDLDPEADAGACPGRDLPETGQGEAVGAKYGTLSLHLPAFPRSLPCPCPTCPRPCVR
jgi:hypothetical protein